MKLVYKINKDIFISCKMYCYIINKIEFINKAKSIKSSSLKYIDYYNLLINNNIIIAIES